MPLIPYKNLTIPSNPVGNAGVAITDNFKTIADELETYSLLPAASITSDQITNWDTAYSWGDHAGLYDPTGTASGLISSHESTYDHTLIATALQAETDPVFTAWLGTSPLDSYVPYSGATTGVDLGSQTLTTTGLVTTGSLTTTVGGITLLSGQNIKPSSDSTTALNISQADGTAFVILNTTNKYVGIGATPVVLLDVRDVTNTDIEVARFSSYGDLGAVIGKTYIGFHHWAAGVAAVSNPPVRIGVEETSVASYDANLVFQTRSSGTNIVPTTRWTIESDGTLKGALDSQKLYLGASKDVYTSYTGTYWDFDIAQTTSAIRFNPSASATGYEFYGTDGTAQVAAIQNIRTNYPQLILNATGGASNAKIWRMIGRSNNHFQLQTLTDVYGGEVSFMDVTRSGTTISNVTFPNGLVSIGTTSTVGKFYVLTTDTTIAGKVVISSASNQYGQIQVGNASGKEVSLCYIGNVSAFAANPGPTSTSGDTFVFNQGVGLYSSLGSQYSISNKNYGGPIFLIDSAGGVASGTYANNAQVVAPPANGMIISGSVGIGTDTPDDKLQVAGNVIIGDGSAGVDYTLTFDGETNNGVLTWKEDEAVFDFNNPLIIQNIKSGATQAAANAAAGELWKTSGHATLPDNVVMIGV